MLRDYFDKVYLINLTKRKDRLQQATAECKSIGLPFLRVNAIDGEELPIEVTPYKMFDGDFWNKGAYGLLLTTIAIIEDAKKNHYKSILILEDDVFFDKNINSVFDKYAKDIPDDWHMILLGSLDAAQPKMINEVIGIANFSYCLHCYAVSMNIYDYYLDRLKVKNKQIDLITAEDIQPLEKTYVFKPNLAFQKASFSDIMKMNVGSKI